MAQLTDKQIKDRAYYAANAEKIKAQKRDKYKPQSAIIINDGLENNEHIP